MSQGLKITLKGGERIYINGAVLKMDRKVGIELLNEATFLLEQHILQPEGATSPLRQLYFMVQMMLIDPSLHAKAKDMANETIAAMQAAMRNEEIANGLKDVSRLLLAERTLEALKKLRSMYAVEAAFLQAELVSETLQKEVA
jgi:flagellar biosynthesis repressor protein FlbT